MKCQKWKCLQNFPKFPEMSILESRGDQPQTSHILQLEDNPDSFLLGDTF